MAWVKLTHRDTGEVQYASSLSGVGKEWIVVPITEDRCPGPFESVADDGTIVFDQDDADAAAEAQRLSGLSRVELMAEIVAQLTDEIAKRDVQIAELAQGARVSITPVDQVEITPTDPAAISTSI